MQRIYVFHFSGETRKFQLIYECTNKLLLTDDTLFMGIEWHFYTVGTYIYTSKLIGVNLLLPPFQFIIFKYLNLEVLVEIFHNW